MLHILLYEWLSKFEQPHETVWNSLIEFIRNKQYREKEIFLNHGDYVKRVAFIVSGLALGFVYKKEKWHLRRIWQTGDIILLIDKAFANEPSDMQIIFRKDTQVLELSLKKLQILKKEFDQIDRYIWYFHAQDNKFMTKYYNWLNEFNDEYKLKEFEQNYPDIQSLLLDKEKASYIGASERWYNSLKNKRK